ncbi:ABC transporter permease [Scatolibacter rhodanostii]|uniref:ABC transporter permease n=1 Tax=Scatolibacter rhodanostii TaxID=2014781 RepID=UPI000C07F42F|nr:ABC transporter permease [Scatolibacter rhodanostii]
MNKLFYPKLALSNIKKNGKTYGPYILISTVTIAMFYMILTLSVNPGLRDMSGGGVMGSILGFGTIITGIFAIVLLFYTNSFLMKRRKKEFGLLNILGMEKRHLGRVIFFETLFIACVAIFVGLLSGVLFSKFLFLIIQNMIGEGITLTFGIDVSSMTISVAFFAVVYLLILLNSVIQIYKSNPIELLKGGQVGEKEPKSKWILSVIGIICLAAGYVISIITKQPISAIPNFFMAVLLVIVGTYMVFTAVSITALKTLKKNKSYYYKSNHFISVSGMIYRMKQNAVGLANICILSTMVLVMISTTFSLFVGADDIMTTRYPKEFEIRGDYQEQTPEQVKQLVEKIALEKGKEITNVETYSYLAVATGSEENRLIASETFSNDSLIMNIYTLDRYNEIMGTNETLGENEALFYNEEQKLYQYDTIDVLGVPLNIKGHFEAPDKLKDLIYMAEPCTLIVKDVSMIEKIQQAQVEAFGEDSYLTKYIYLFDMEGDREELQKITNDLETERQTMNLDTVTVDSRVNSWSDFMAIYGGLFFIGIFLGILFIMAAIMIMYYKQISEGYDDKERFQIMKKVGLSEKEVKKTIHSQVIMVFFLPLVTAIVHLAFAFPIITRLLAALSMTNIALFAICTVGCVLIFTLFYAIVYTLTAKSYYKIVK